jgi:hypothetical protein
VILRPPAAAPAAGGRRIADSLFVHSVGSPRVPLVGVVEEETPAMRVLKTAPLSFVGGVPWSSGGVRVSSSSSAFCGSAEFFFPRADRRRPIWYQLILKMKMAWSLAMKTTASDVGPQGPLSGDFPAAWGLLPFQGVRGAAADPARHRLVLVGVDIGVWRDLCVIFCFLLSLFVRLKL